MILESLRLKNFKAFKDAEMRDIPRLCAIVGANGSGKSTLFSVFKFLKDAMMNDVQVAMDNLAGRSQGFQEVRSRGSDGEIMIELKFRKDEQSPLISYFLDINEENGKAFIETESLIDHGNGLTVLYNKKGICQVRADGSDPTKSPQIKALKSPSLLGVKSFSQFKEFSTAILLGELISGWHLSEIQINNARFDSNAGYAEHLSREGENLALVTEYLFKQRPEIFQTILDKLKQRVPGIAKVEAKETGEGRILLRFHDESFKDPFLARNVSDGTIKMFAYLVLLHDPKPHPLLFVEEPENQLYPKLLEELAEEFRDYARRGGQVFVSTHSPDFLNACELDEVFWLVKEKGYTQIRRAAEDEQIKIYMNDGDKMGYLWKQGFFQQADPQ